VIESNVEYNSVDTEITQFVLRKGAVYAKVSRLQVISIPRTENEGRDVCNPALKLKL
jgi:hypothetical protein